jgi:hypothetical protein
MPKDKDFKALVRTRMAMTGERYTEARASVDDRRRLTDPSQPEIQEWVERLAAAETYLPAYLTLKELPAEVLRPVATQATRHPNWRVRRGACRLLDDLDFTADSFAALQACLDDPEPRVRRAATHSLTCQHCKPDGCVVDVRAVFERALQDANRTVRKMAVGPLTYGSDEPWRRELLRQVFEHDASAALRQVARQALEHFELRDRSDSERRHLPPELRVKTERHPGKWVAISNGSIIDVGGHPPSMVRTAHKHGHKEVTVYWVRAE